VHSKHSKQEYNVEKNVKQKNQKLREKDSWYESYWDNTDFSTLVVEGVFVS
jgi:hypothetical protein